MQRQQEVLSFTQRSRAPHPSLLRAMPALASARPSLPSWDDGRAAPIPLSRPVPVTDPAPASSHAPWVSGTSWVFGDSDQSPSLLHLATVPWLVLHFSPATRPLAPLFPLFPLLFFLFSFSSRFSVSTSCLSPIVRPFSALSQPLKTVVAARALSLSSSRLSSLAGDS